VPRESAAQFANSLSQADGGPARHALEVNLSLNAFGIRTQLLSVGRRTKDCVVDSAALQELHGLGAPSPIFLREIGRPSSRDLGVLRARSWILHGYYLLWLPALALLGFVLGKKIIVMPHGSLTKFDRARSPLKKAIFRYLAGGWFVDRVANFVVASEVERNELPSRRVRDSAVVVGAGTRLLGHDPIVRPSQSPVVLVSLSRIAAKKRIDLTIGAVRELLNRGVEVRARIYGAGAEGDLDQLMAQVVSLGLEDYVAFHGQVQGGEKLDALRSGDIFVLPSDDENFGIALAEALSLGLPAVTSQWVGAANGLRPPAGVVLGVVDPPQIASAVQELLHNYQAGSAAARQFAEETFDWQRVAERWAQVITGASRFAKGRITE
jgi:glycosyltransferase involved in cell wall biosynthesis